MINFPTFSKTVAIAVIFNIAFAIDIAHTQQSYPMTCRGGGTLSIKNDGEKGVRIQFQPGSGAAPQGLSPGQCTWSDRALTFEGFGEL